VTVVRGRGIQINKPPLPERPSLVPGDPKATARNRSTAKHLIARVHWPEKVRPEEYDGCPIECQCGWEGKVGEWLAHRGTTDKEKERRDG
jgi:hypothetical protein